MNELDKDLGVATALIERLRTQRLPRALEIKARVDNGECLVERDLTFLHEVFETAEQIRPLVERHPEYQEIYSQALDLYRSITEKALENEQAAGTPR